MLRTLAAALVLGIVMACGSSFAGDMIVYGPVPTNGPNQTGDYDSYPKTDPMSSSGGSDVSSTTSRYPYGPTGSGGASGGTITSTSSNWGGTGFSSPGTR